MNKSMIGLIILIAIGVIIGSSGQMFLKKGLTEIGPLDAKITTFFSIIFKILTNKFVFLGLSLSAVAAFFWILALSNTNLSVAYPIAGGLFYLSIIALSIIFLGEKINLTQIIGTIITFLGIVILTKS